MPSHWHIDRDCVALLDAERFEHVGDTANFLEKLAIGDSFAVRRLVRLVNDGGLD